MIKQLEHMVLEQLSLRGKPGIIAELAPYCCIRPKGAYGIRSAAEGSSPESRGISLGLGLDQRALGEFGEGELCDPT